MVHDENFLVLDVGSHCSAEVAIIHPHFEIMVNLPLVRGKVVLILLVGDAKLLGLHEKNHAALHEVHHDILQLGDPRFLAEFIEIDVLVFNDLKSAHRLIARD